MTVSKDFDGFTPYLGVAYINDVDRSAAKVTADGKRTITGESALPGRSALQLRAGATWQLTETLDLNAGYTAELREKATEQSANIGIGLTF
jgi:outer membrane autotransporter protein